jgi:hypothetical protein
MTSIAHLSTVLQTILTTVADAAAKETGFIQRQRTVTGRGFVQTAVLGWLANPQASLKQLAQRAAALGMVLSPQGLGERFSEAAAQCLRQVLEAAVQQVVRGEPVAIPLLRRFPAVVVYDGSTIALPAELATVWPGCGGSTPAAGAAALKLQPRIDLVCGRIDLLEVQTGRTSDQTAQSQTAPLPQGSLTLFDLGFFALDVLEARQQAGVHWLCRPKLQTALFTAEGRRWTLGDVLRARCAHSLDAPIRLGARHRLPCRLLASRLPPEIVALRRQRLVEAARREQTQPSREQLDLAAWAVFVTTVPADRLSLPEALTLYRMRWQIELLFKRWKSHGEIDQSRSDQPWRVLGEVYAKLLAMLVQHWLLLVSCWGFPDKSLWQAAQTVRAHAVTLISAFRSGSRRRLQEELRLIQTTIATGCRMDSRRTHPNAYQLLLALTADEEAA